MHNYPLLEIMAIGLTLALVLGYITNRIGLSPIVGYLIAGILVGPHTPGFVVDNTLAQELAEAGIILLMFGVGLHFNMKDLWSVKGVAVPGALIQCTVTTSCGVLVATMMGMSLGNGLILGLGMAVASTVVLLRVLADNGVVEAIQHVAVGWLVVEDIFTVLVLVIMPGVATALVKTGTLEFMPLLIALAGGIGRLIILWIIVLVVGGKVVPWLLSKVARTRSQELFTLTVLVIAFAIAMGAAVFFHASVALGAFLGGMVVGKSNVSHQAGADILPLRDAFAVIFFLSVGMLFDPMFLINNPMLVLVCLLVVLLIKPITSLIVVTLLGYSTRTALTVATGLSQIGEFSFILASEALANKLIGPEVHSLLIVCALISITINSGYFKLIPFFERILQKHPRLWRLMNARADRKALGGNERLREGFSDEFLEQNSIAIVVGHGPTGRSVIDAMVEKDITPVVIDMNVDTVNSLTDKGRKAIFGDASKKEILNAAGIEKADYLILTVPDIAATVAAASLARNMNGKIRILARARFINDAGVLKQIGVTAVAFEEEEIAQALARLVSSDLDRCADSQHTMDQAAQQDG